MKINYLQSNSILIVVLFVAFMCFLCLAFYLLCNMLVLCCLWMFWKILEDLQKRAKKSYFLRWSWRSFLLQFSFLFITHFEWIRYKNIKTLFAYCFNFITYWNKTRYKKRCFVWLCVVFCPFFALLFCLCVVAYSYE